MELKKLKLVINEFLDKEIVLDGWVKKIELKRILVLLS